MCIQYVLGGKIDGAGVEEFRHASPDEFPCDSKESQVRDRRIGNTDLFEHLAANMKSRQRGAIHPALDDITLIECPGESRAELIGSD